MENQIFKEMRYKDRKLIFDVNNFLKDYQNKKENIFQKKDKKVE